MWVIAMTVPFTDLAIAAVDQQLGSLILRDATPGGSRIGLSIMTRGVATVASASDCPGPVVTRDHMLIRTHDYLLGWLVFS
jgi:hypothetical protein